MIATHVTIPQREKLPDAQDVQAFSEDDQDLFDELYKVLARHGALRRFGITLLHQHFEIADDEVLLERTDRDNRRQLIEPVKISSLEGKNPIQT